MLLFFACCIIALVQGGRIEHAQAATATTQADRDAQRWESRVDQIYPDPNWLMSFRGRLRLWICEWAVDPEGQVKPYSYRISIHEFRLCPDGIEEWKPLWGWPVSSNLQPNFSYGMTTSANMLTISRNDDQIRGLIEPNSHGSDIVRQSFIFSFLKDPLMQSQVNNDYRDGFNLVEDVSSPKLEYIKGMGDMPNGPGGNTKRTLVIGIDKARDGSPIAIDIVHDVKDLLTGDWTLHDEYSGRILESQTLQVADQHITIPRILLTEEVAVRPLVTSKRDDFRRLMLLDVIPDQKQQLTNDWQAIIGSSYRVADLTHGIVNLKPEVMGVPLLQRFLDDVDDTSAPFIALLRTDLQAKYALLFRNVQDMVGEATSSSVPIGTLEANRSFRAIDPPLETAPNRPISTTYPSLALTQTIQLLFKGSPHAADDADQAGMPEHQGFIPVDPADQLESRVVLGTISTVSILASAASGALLFLRKRTRVA